MNEFSKATNMKPRTQAEKAVTDFLRSLRERNSSPHTIKAYTGDLQNFAAYVGCAKLAQYRSCHDPRIPFPSLRKRLGKTSVARSLAAVRSLYRCLAQQGVVEQNPAALVSTPKLPKKLPRVPTIEEMNSVLDGQMPEVAAFPGTRPPHARIALRLRHPQLRARWNQS